MQTKLLFESAAVQDAPAKTVSVMEYAVGGDAPKIDEAAGVLRGVKVLGLQSLNTGRTLGLSERQYGAAVDKPYRYAIEGVRAAVPLYEGARVYTNHPDFTYSSTGERRAVSSDRKTGEAFGRLRDVRATEDGMYADLHYLKSHPLAAQVIEAASRMPDMFALSHQAITNVALKNGEIVLDAIKSVKSVDLISERPGTTVGLYESHQETPVPTTLKQVVETLDAKSKGRLALEAMMDGSPGMEAATMPEDYTVPGDASTATNDAFGTMITAVLADTTMSITDKKAKVLAIFDAWEQLEGGGAAAGDGEADAAAAEESSKAAAATGTTVYECIDLLNEHKIPVTAQAVETLSVLATPEKRKAKAKWLASLVPVAEAKGATPARSAGPVTKTVAESAADGAKKPTPGEIIKAARTAR